MCSWRSLHGRYYRPAGKNEAIKMKQSIEREAYFVINRGRQYGKTTTLAALQRYLATEYTAYTAILLSFQGVDDESFENAQNFCQMFLNAVRKKLRFAGASRSNLPTRCLPSANRLCQKTRRETWLPSHLQLSPEKRNQFKFNAKRV